MEPTGKPTVKQVYALAAVLCQMVDETFPATRAGASELIERFRRELGHPQPRLDERPWHSRRRVAEPSPKTVAIRGFISDLED